MYTIRSRRYTNAVASSAAFFGLFQSVRKPLSDLATSAMALAVSTVTASAATTATGATTATATAAAAAAAGTAVTAVANSGIIS
jgi:hypothetical protein